jgi:hypothetical protein
MQETTPISFSSQDFPRCSTQLAQNDSEASAPKAAVLCSHRTRKGRPCQLPVLDTSSGLCFRHSGLHVPKKDPDDLSADLLDKLTEFHSPYEVNEFLARLLFLLVRNRISPKRAGVLTYIAAQLLHSLGQVRLVEKDEKDEPVEIILDCPRPQRD